jgi:probable rRNA maturation factor
VHGVLHLAGYDDQTEAGYNAMVRLQDAILAEVNISK